MNEKDFDINKDISYIPFFIFKEPFKNKTKEDFFITDYGDTELWYIMREQAGKDTVDSYCIEKNKDGSINWIREVCYINDSVNNVYKISIDKDGNIIEMFPDGHVEEKSVEQAAINRDINFGDDDFGDPNKGPQK